MAASDSFDTFPVSSVVSGGGRVLSPNSIHGISRSRLAPCGKPVDTRVRQMAGRDSSACGRSVLKRCGRGSDRVLRRNSICQDGTREITGDVLVVVEEPL